MAKVGDILNNEYKLIKLIGSGGFGDVFIAYNINLEKKVAIKVLHPQYMNNSEILERFRRDAIAAAKLDHKHIREVFNLKMSQEGQYFIIMKYVEGETLDKLMKRGGILPIKTVLTIIKQLLSALDYAHVNEIIHRDIKPENIILVDTDNGTCFIKLLDFGIAKFKEAKITVTGMTLGTPSYESPEQVKDSANVDIRTDIYSIGVIMYEMLTGRLPYEGKDNINIIVKIVSRTSFANPSSLNGAVSQQLEDMILKAMSWNRNDRFNDCKEFMRYLERFEREEADRQAFTPHMMHGPQQGVSSGKPLFHNMQAHVQERSGAGPSITSKSTEIPRKASGKRIIYLVGGIIVLVVMFGFVLLFFALQRFSETFAAFQSPDAKSSPALGPYDLSRSQNRKMEERQSKARKSIVINSNPPGAAIIIDGIDSGEKTPSTHTFIDRNEPYIIKINLIYFRPSEFTVLYSDLEEINTDLTTEY